MVDVGKMVEGIDEVKERDSIDQRREEVEDRKGTNCEH